MVVQLLLDAYAKRTFIHGSAGSESSPYTQRIKSERRSRPLTVFMARFRSLLVTEPPAWAAGERFDTAKWIAMVTAKPGADARGRFDRLIPHGTDTLDPRRDVFGACFRLAAMTSNKNGKTIPGHRWVRILGIPDLRP
jgi:hypothetical protein